MKVDKKTGTFRLILEKGYSEDEEIKRKHSSGTPSSGKKKRIPLIKRDLDARARIESFRAKFRLPLDEKLDGEASCFLWCPYNKAHASGRLFIGHNYACFESKVERLVAVIIPYSEMTVEIPK